MKNSETSTATLQSSGFEREAVFGNGNRSEFVSTGLLSPGQPLPLVIRPREGRPQLQRTTEWLRAFREALNVELVKYGAILFRGFGLQTVEDVSAFAAAMSDELLEYSERSSPRSHLNDRVYTSTDYPPAQRIFLHNEHSYSMTFPMKLFFCCLIPAQQGGETPIADVRRVAARISSETKELFRRKNWMYTRNFGDGLGLSWQTAFQTSDEKVVERYCNEHRIEFEWKDDQRLRTRQIRPVYATHPRTGEPVWFNHTTFFHVSTLDETMREVLLAEFEEQDLPNNTYYGDGSSIEPEVMDELRAAYDEESIKFPWEQGDIMLVDNMLTAHGRSSYAGQRKVVVAMSEPIQRSDISFL
ncbi:MAG TPA: TauD/TfdA family dioxygenase [Candidatus Angelobacter sp.]|nr:TauD/TfdA family dioxygenase [Candidatus Angelobacter sp.]